MELAVNENYQRIAKVIDYLQTHFDQQPNLEELAEIAHLSPFHFQRLFSDWAGTSPKKFLQYISLEYAKSILKQNDITLADAAFQTGLSGTGRLHDLFVQFEGMSPGEYKNGAANLTINYSIADSPFGLLVVASTAKGICYMAFIHNPDDAVPDIRSRFPNAHLVEHQVEFHSQALGIFQSDWSNLNGIKLHLKGTPFQLKVWEALLKIPLGNLSTYGTIAEKIGNPNASRAVGTAIGSNPVAFIIPCHRVIQSSGLIGGYMWGPHRKKAIIGWEAAQINHQG